MAIVEQMDSQVSRSMIIVMVLKRYNHGRVGRSIDDIRLAVSYYGVQVADWAFYPTAKFDVQLVAKT